MPRFVAHKGINSLHYGLPCRIAEKKTIGQVKIKFIDLFAGIGGMRLGLEKACASLVHTTSCVFTSEIKPHAVSVLRQNFPDETIHGDITRIAVANIPDFDLLCAGFPCQAFSVAGSRKGFADTRGTLFFEVERVLKAKKPKGFILENVEGLLHHDKGRTLNTILGNLQKLGYRVSYSVLNSKYFGVAQERKRIYIVGNYRGAVNLENFPVREVSLAAALSSNMPLMRSPLADRLLARYKPHELYGKSIKDKRGGANNIHSWDLCLKGKTSPEERELLNRILTERRKKKWAEMYGIDWMDGMPLTREMIATFYPHDALDALLDGLVQKGYLTYEHPKRKAVTRNAEGLTINYREPDTSLPKGYNIVAGKLSFEISKILDPASVAPTLVATDVSKLAVVDGQGLRRLTLREGLRLFGFPESYRFEVSESEGFDLLGNTVVVPVVEEVCKRLIKTIQENRITTPTY